MDIYAQESVSKHSMQMNTEQSVGVLLAAVLSFQKENVLIWILSETERN